MKRLLFILWGIMIMNTPAHANTTAHQFSFDALMSPQPVALQDYSGKVMLIVNTASKCGFTGQYKGLEALYQQYKNDGLVVIGVPSNDFGAQEPASAEQIADFCEINYGVTFPMTAKYAVKGRNAHPFYAWAKQELGFGTAPKWNFHKYLVNREGQLVDYFHSTTSPDANRLVAAIKTLLAEQ